MAVLDSRLETARGYGAFLRKLAAAVLVHHQAEVVQSALQRLAAGHVVAEPVAPPRATSEV